MLIPEKGACGAISRSSSDTRDGSDELAQTVSEVPDVVNPVVRRGASRFTLPEPGTCFCRTASESSREGDGMSPA